ncbi:Zinc/iron permease [Polychytrium aggregatum]|uniref:Zinc/iron permease n=1 Tax=Polychytrium aggregatum TaxID=110093 RepID=UPI0022FF26EA|nr:Zinc/iron permease [Polychytrium aggregatum]KAI9209703.1 Zinc/iron permease [Polychytrium aggregatum]
MSGNWAPLTPDMLGSNNVSNINFDQLNLQCMSCAPGALDDNFNLPLHIGGIFIIFTISCIGLYSTTFLGFRTVSPARDDETSSSTLKETSGSVGFLLHYIKLFGIGVIASTAWLHVLTSAFGNFTSPCLVGFWNLYGGSNWVGLFGLVATLLVNALEYILTQKATRQSLEKSKSLDSHVELAGHFHGFPGNKSITTLLIEASISFHSIIIGLALGVATDEFNSLLVAICFHQFFEGMALGSLIRDLPYTPLKKFVIGLVYPVTTPIGMAIGIGLRSALQNNSQVSIVVQGIFDSLASGVLIYNVYAELFSNEINHNHNFRGLSRAQQVISFCVLYIGAAAMAIVAVWA